MLLYASLKTVSIAVKHAGVMEAVRNAKVSSVRDSARIFFLFNDIENSRMNAKMRQNPEVATFLVLQEGTVTAKFPPYGFDVSSRRLQQRGWVSQSSWR